MRWEGVVLGLGRRRDEFVVGMGVSLLDEESEGLI